MSKPNTAPGFSTINPFIITRNADGLFRFLQEVFGGVEHPNARTVDPDGLLLHAELEIGGTTVALADRKPGWPHIPSLLQIYVDDVESTLERAAARGAEIMTRPTPFFGDVFSRFLDPWGNLWWVYSTDGAQDQGEYGASDWSTSEASDASDEAWADTAWEPTPELTYIHDTLLAVLPRLREE